MGIHICQLLLYFLAPLHHQLCCFYQKGVILWLKGLFSAGFDIGLGFRVLDMVL